MSMRGDTANTQVSIHKFDGDKTIVHEVRGLETDPHVARKDREHLLRHGRCASC